MDSNSRKDYSIKSCGCRGINVWQVWLVEYTKDMRGQERMRYIRAVTNKMSKPQAEKELVEFKKKLDNV